MNAQLHIHAKMMAHVTTALAHIRVTVQGQAMKEQFVTQVNISTDL